MNEVRRESQLGVRIAKAQALIERGKERRALDELWEAEAQARGNGNAIHELIDFTTALEDRVERRQSSRLAELVATLEHGAKQASLVPVTTAADEPNQGRRRWPGGFRGVLLAVLVLGGVGVVLGAVIGAAAGSCDPNKDICIGSQGDWAAIGAIFLGLAGAGIALLGSLLWLLGRMTARHRSGADS